MHQPLSFPNSQGGQGGERQGSCSPLPSNLVGFSLCQVVIY